MKELIAIFIAFVLGRPLPSISSLRFALALINPKPECYDERVLAKARMNEILDAIRLKDKDALLALFSKKALSEAIGMDDAADYLFGLVDGEILSCEGGVGEFRQGYSTRESGI